MYEGGGCGAAEVLAERGRQCGGTKALRDRTLPQTNTQSTPAPTAPSQPRVPHPPNACMPNCSHPARVKKTPPQGVPTRPSTRSGFAKNPSSMVPRTPLPKCTAPESRGSSMPMRSWARGGARGAAMRRRRRRAAGGGQRMAGRQPRRRQAAGCGGSPAARPASPSASPSRGAAPRGGRRRRRSRPR